MLRVYFPVVSCKEHLSKHSCQHSREEFAIHVETEKIHDTIIVEIITLSAILKILGCEEERNGKKTFHQKISEQQKNIIGGLIQRLLNQLPAYEFNTEIRSDNFGDKVTNFYQMLEQRLQMKKIYKEILSIDHTANFSDCAVITERVANFVMEYEAYCEVEEANI